MRAGQEKNKNEDTEVMWSNLQWQLHLFVGLFVVQTYMSLFFS
jgi:cyanate permease